MNKYLIESFLDNKVWDSYNGEFIKAESYDDALKAYKQLLLDGGEFSEEEVDKMLYRAGAQTKYILRRRDNMKILGKYDSYDEGISELFKYGNDYCLEECEINISGEPASESRWHFVE